MLCLLAAVWIANRQHGHGHGQPAGETDISCSSCGGTNAKCSRDCMMEAAINEIEYFDDEELDAFAGRSSDDYKQEEIDMFSDILYTMKEEEIQEWCRSLTLRHIELPDELKDEVVMMINDGNS